MPIKKLFTCSEKETHHIEAWVNADDTISLNIKDISTETILAGVVLDEDTYREFIHDLSYEVNKHFG